MEAVSHKKPSARIKQRTWITLVAIPLVALTVATWLWRTNSSAVKPKEAGVVQVVSAVVAQADVSVRLTANGTVSALQMVDVRPQISATVKAVYIKEGQFVRKGDRMFLLDARTEDANLSKSAAQVAKDRTDLMNAERNLERQRELFRQEFVSRAEFEAAQNQVDVLRGQLEVDRASVEASHVAHSFSEITAPISGRTGAIAIYPGSLVQPIGVALVNITQIDPINVSFTLPERELAALQQAFAKGEVPVSAKLDQADQPVLKGRLVFIDNAVDMASGTIRLKAEFPNADHRLWPGMFVTVSLAPRMLAGALTVPAQAVQTGPERKFLYVIGEGRKVAAQPVNVRLIQDGFAVIDGIAPGTRVVVEGAQNLRPGSVVSESKAAEKIPEKTSEKASNRVTAQPSSAGKQ